MDNYNNYIQELLFHWKPKEWLIQWSMHHWIYTLTITYTNTKGWFFQPPSQLNIVYLYRQWIDSVSLKNFPSSNISFFCIVLLYIKSTVHFIKIKACKFPRNIIYKTICLLFYWFTHNVDSLLKNATRFRCTEFVKPLENVYGLAFNILKKSRLILFSFSLLILSCFII